jgi:phosphoglycerate kinase
MDKLTVRDFDARDKRVLVRVDFNVPLEDGKVTDDSRIRASLPTIVHLMSQGARVVLASHLGRPDGKVQDGLRLRPVGERLSLLLRRSVPVTGDALGPGTEDAIKRIRPGDALLLENLRFHAEEERNDPGFAAALAAYADIYVNDAFGTAHRAHASTVGIAKLLPAYAGLLMEREIRALSKLLENPEHPYAAILGGAKVSGKIKVIDNLLTKVDVLILGGGMANTFLLAQGKAVGKSLAEHDMVDEARTLLAKAEKRGAQVVLPVDVIVAKEVTRGTEYKTLPADKIPASWHIVDVGSQTLALIETALRDVRTVVWNGPIGVFEIPVFGAGTRHVARLLADKAGAGATVVVGGGDSVAAVQQQGLAGSMTHLSTGGGASLEFLEGRELPGIAVLQDRPKPTLVPEADPPPADQPTPALAGASPAAPRQTTDPRRSAARATTVQPATAERMLAPSVAPTRRPAIADARRRAPVNENPPAMEAPGQMPTSDAPATPEGVQRTSTPPKAATRKPAAAKRKPAAAKRKPARAKSAASARKRPTAKRKPAAKSAARKPATRKPATAKRKPAAKSATRKSPTARKKPAARKAAARKPAAAQRKPAAKSATRKSSAARKPATAKRKPAATKSATRKSAAARKPATAKRKPAATKSAARKTSTARKPTTAKKKPATTRRTTARRKSPGR